MCSVDVQCLCKDNVEAKEITDKFIKGGCLKSSRVRVPTEHEEGEEENETGGDTVTSAFEDVAEDRKIKEKEQELTEVETICDQQTDSGVGMDFRDNLVRDDCEDQLESAMTSLQRLTVTQGTMSNAEVIGRGPPVAKTMRFDQSNSASICKKSSKPTESVNKYSIEPTPSQHELFHYAAPTQSAFSWLQPTFQFAPKMNGFPQHNVSYNQLRHDYSTRAPDSEWSLTRMLTSIEPPPRQQHMQAGWTDCCQAQQVSQNVPTTIDPSNITSFGETRQVVTHDFESVQEKLAIERIKGHLMASDETDPTDAIASLGTCPSLVTGDANEELPAIFGNYDVAQVPVTSSAKTSASLVGETDSIDFQLIPSDNTHHSYWDVDQSLADIVVNNTNLNCQLSCSQVTGTSQHQAESQSSETYSYNRSPFQTVPGILNDNVFHDDDFYIPHASPDGFPEHPSISKPCQSTVINNLHPKNPQVMTSHVKVLECSNDPLSFINLAHQDQPTREHQPLALALHSTQTHFLDTLHAPTSRNENRTKVIDCNRKAAGLSVAELLAKTDEGDSLLHTAMIDEDWMMVDALLDRYERSGLMDRIVNVTNKRQQSVLCLAVILNKSGVVERLLHHQADVNAQIIKGRDAGLKFEQPVHFSAARGHDWDATLRAILRVPNVQINAYNSEGRTALHCAIEAHGKPQGSQRIDSIPAIKLLAVNKADLNAPDRQSEKTPLHYAIEKRCVDIVTTLLALAGSMVDQQRHGGVAKLLTAKTGGGNAALHLAASIQMRSSEQRRLVQLLLSKGADPSAKNGEGLLPRELTKNTELVDLLKGKPGVRVNTKI